MSRVKSALVNPDTCRDCDASGAVVVPEHDPTSTTYYGQVPIAHVLDTCVHCGGSGERIHAASFATSHASYPGYAYDEHAEPCRPCEGTGLDQHYYTQGPSLEEAAEEHELITEQKEQSAWTF